MITSVTLYPGGMVGFAPEALEEAIESTNDLTFDGEVIWKKVKNKEGEEEMEHLMEPLLGEDWIFIENNDCIVLEYTGRKDKNDAWIYEGDIFRIEEDDVILYTVVVWVQEWCMFCTLIVDEYLQYLQKGMKTIDEPMFWTYTLEDTDSPKHYLCGNIHKNPELLKAEEIS